jgi:hypothetical protein
MFKLFKGHVSMCQRTNCRLDVIEPKLDANAYNQRLIHSKLQIEVPLKEVPKDEDLPEPIDPFTFLTLDELNYFEMDESHFRGVSGGADSGDDNGSDNDYEEEDNDVAK